jgi:hypothetical protein
VHCAGSAAALQQHAAGGLYFSAACRLVAPAGHAAAADLSDWLWPWAADLLQLTSSEQAAALRGSDGEPQH